MKVCEPLPPDLRQAILTRVLAIVEDGTRWNQEIFSADVEYASEVEHTCRTAACVAGHIVHESVACGYSVGFAGWANGAGLLASIPVEVRHVLFHQHLDRHGVVTLLRQLLADSDERTCLRTALDLVCSPDRGGLTGAAAEALALRCEQRLQKLQEGD